MATELPRPRLYINTNVIIPGKENGQGWSLQWTGKDDQPYGVQRRVTNRDLAKHRNQVIAAIVTELIDEYLWWVEGELEEEDAILEDRTAALLKAVSSTPVVKLPEATDE